ncbi:hypothetical protein BOW65_13655 [Pseudomonas koreensis]|jgi:hypothetical protein|uniref:hypothetical protein n=1 Tax=Pseudomonas koreensis TaxID=198620 RepID=UPI0009856174|nr:hypothetical protein [Pseudomonas koreensis]OOH80013.1 hypothetical protein BOW65_13655 [Pseudomonas koreensis]
MAELWKPVGGVFWKVAPPERVPEVFSLSTTILCGVITAFVVTALLNYFSQKVSPQSWKLRKHLGAVGIAMTLAYLAIILPIIWGRAGTLLTMPLNEVGDFLAGVIGTIGLFWLVLGFMQQSEGLRLSTDALKIQATELQQSTGALKDQAKELKSSVDQQKIMATLAAKQIEAQLQALKLQIEERDKSLLADFSFSSEPLPTDTEEEVMVHKCTLENLGKDAYGVRVEYDTWWQGTQSQSLGDIRSNSFKIYNLTFPTSGSGVSGTFRILYEDGQGTIRSQSFRYSCREPEYWFFAEKIRTPPLHPPYFITAEFVER